MSLPNKYVSPGISTCEPPKWDKYCETCLNKETFFTSGNSFIWCEICNEGKLFFKKESFPGGFKKAERNKRIDDLLD